MLLNNSTVRSTSRRRTVRIWRLQKRSSWHFPPLTARPALSLGGRNTLLNTFLFYQSVAYMGTSAGDWMMALNRSDEGHFDTAFSFLDGLDDIQVSVRNRKGDWILVGSFTETGPIAREVQLIVLLPTESAIISSSTRRRSEFRCA